MNLVGICTHFPLADTDEIETKRSIKLFENTIKGELKIVISEKNLKVESFDEKKTT